MLQICFLVHLDFSLSLRIFDPIQLASDTCFLEGWSWILKALRATAFVSQLLACHRSPKATAGSMEISVHDSVPVKLYLQKSGAGLEFPSSCFRKVCVSNVFCLFLYVNTEFYAQKRTFPLQD